MRIRRVFSSLCIIAVALVLASSALASPAPAAERDITVMTRNMDAGTDFTLVAFAPPALFADAVGATIDEVVQSNIPARAALLAAEIANTKPDVIALQEVTTWKIGKGRKAVDLDQLELLMNALRAEHQHYEIVAVQRLTHIDIDLQIPQIPPVSFTDHNAILVRSGQLDVLKAKTHIYEDNMVFLTAAGDIPILSGWMTADIRFRDSRFRLVNTHLASATGTPETMALQLAQANELVEALADSDLPTIIAGDFNSDASPTTWFPPDKTGSADHIVSSGYTDVWNALNPSDIGYTWPLFAEDDMPFDSGPFERIDLIFSNGLEADSIEMTGTTPDKHGLYASDHAGVVAVFDITKHHPHKH